jgi:hypothetical protein
VFWALLQGFCPGLQLKAETALGLADNAEYEGGSLCWREKAGRLARVRICVLKNGWTFF